MATQYGQLGEYHSETEGISSYLERVEVFLSVNGIEEDKQSAVFLSVVGARTFAPLRDLVTPAKPAEMSLADLCYTLWSHYEPKPIVVAERYYFHSRSQGPMESIAEFLAELRRLATHCQFGAQLNEALRDRLVCGLRNPAIQKRLLAEADLDLAKALKLAQGIEAADTNMKKLQDGDHENVNVYYGDRKACYRCGSMEHRAGTCKFKQAECYNCGRKGHIARVCRGARKKDAPHTEPSQSHHSAQK